MPSSRRRRDPLPLRGAIGVLLIAVAVAAVVLIVLAVAAIGGVRACSPRLSPSDSGSASATAEAAAVQWGNSVPELGEASMSPAAQRAASGLVEITADDGEGQRKAGTGIVLSSDGTVVTNVHVITTSRDVSSESIQAEDPATDTTYDAEVVGTDRAHDIAVLQLRDAEDLPTAGLGHSRALRVGQAVISIGNAYGAGALRATTGVITGLGRSIASTTDTSQLAASDDTPSAPRLTGLVEVNTMIVPGDSGGALVDGHGRVVGMTVAYSRRAADGAALGVGWAIPIDTVRAIAAELDTD